MKKQIALAWMALTFAFCSATVSGQANDLSAVLARASMYVAQYEDSELGNVLASENYVQRAVWYSRTGAVSRREERQTKSEFLIVKVGSERMAIRQVLEVDRLPVKKTAPDLETMLDDSRESIVRRIAALRGESTQYNIGGVARQMNLPTFALKVLRGDQAPRFEFVKRGTDRIGGIEALEIRFRELRTPTLIHGLEKESLFSSGTVWVEAATGRVLKTEFSITNKYSNPAAKGKIVVTYTPNAALGMLVPTEMSEHYETDSSGLDCTAKYSNFRSFKVDVSSGSERVLAKP